MSTPSPIPDTGPASESAALSALYTGYLKQWTASRKSRKVGAPEATDRAAEAMLAVRERQRTLTPEIALGSPQPQTLLELNQVTAQARSRPRAAAPAKVACPRCGAVVRPRQLADGGCPSCRGGAGKP